MVFRLLALHNAGVSLPLRIGRLKRSKLLGHIRVCVNRGRMNAAITIGAQLYLLQHIINQVKGERLALSIDFVPYCLGDRIQRLKQRGAHLAFIGLRELVENLGEGINIGGPDNLEWDGQHILKGAKWLVERLRLTNGTAWAAVKGAPDRKLGKQAILRRKTLNNLLHQLNHCLVVAGNIKAKRWCVHRSVLASKLMHDLLIEYAISARQRPSHVLTDG